ncbi:MAG TPA: cytochrome b/b6 domain-containing protein [Oscillatoriaceae cyanobacterium]
MSGRIARFTRGERAYHWGNALAVLFLLGTGTSLWLHLDHYHPRGPHATHGPHYLLLFHVWLGGGGLIAATLLFAALAWRRTQHPAVRFNQGQRVNLRLFQAFIGWMIFSGLLIFNSRTLGIPHATSEIFSKLHLIAAGLIGVLVLGHLAMVLLVPKNRGILSGMVSGSVDRDVAQRVDPEWVASLERSGTVQAAASSESASA